MIKFLTTVLIVSFMLFPRDVYAEINIGVITPFSGDYKKYGNELIQGAMVAVNEINGNGGLLGKKVTLLSLDDPCDDILSVTTAQMIAMNKEEDRKLSMVIGPYCSNSADDIAEIYSKSGIIQILPLTASRNSYHNSYDSLIKMLGYKEQQGSDIYSYFEKNFPNQKFALVYDETMSDSEGVARAIQNEYVVGEKLNKIKSFNYSSYLGDTELLVKAILTEAIDVVYIMGSVDAIAALSKALKEENPQIIVVTNQYQTNKSYIKAMGNLLENTYSIALPSLKENPDFAETLVKMRLLGFEPEGLMAYGYLAVKLWEEGVIKADTFDTKKVSKAINSEVDMGWADVNFSKGNPDKSISYGIYRYSNGEYTQVY